ncbi:Protein of unknown function DUF2202 [Caldithrix abyssi DSM 13497]|uniref:DUF2202 domain-containing protein n=1 Tax=Caldithrix abyssi DSM 13497 TaxID=880073 RepID=H1XYE0_CALAY|nr:DUF2202 domain-containing protein [Caldithrix abyssi]APF19302.1 hypothetical protein Cabys_2553 [Caldithrix abyssi DSM 13497]EHO43207.1 Protein of unknown function DUF2202 [Caldithrix abyssi DSM 13497]
MKRTIITRVLGLVFILSLTFTLVQCSDDSNTVLSSTARSGALTEDVINSFPLEEVSPAEAEGLTFMREEEKLARDVYLTLYGQWGILVFNNISGSEQMHFDAMGYLLQKYNIDDPVVVDSIGVFTNADLQNLYNTLIVQGKDSAAAALKVGALIEEVDIRDLQKELDENVDNEDIQYVYETLMRGSRNHLRAFVSYLSAMGVIYEPQILSQEEYEAIINSPIERGF